MPEFWAEGAMKFDASRSIPWEISRAMQESASGFAMKPSTLILFRRVLRLEEI